MLRLFCAAVGVEGDAFSVEINEGNFVAELNVAIKATKANDLKDVDACELQLFLARKDKGHGAWLTEEEAADVRYDHVPQGFKRMKTTRLLNDSENFGENFQPAGGHVHVLVLFPTDLRIGVDEKYTDVIDSYTTIANRLKETEEVKALSAHMRVEDIAPTPFFVLENSSGTGKTQMAFNLQARGECEVFYIVCGRFGEGEQRVYRAFTERSRAFRHCVNRDLVAMERKTLGNREPIGFVGEICGNTTLALYSFILAALRGRDVVLGTASRSDVNAELARRKERGAKPFVFFLDEFPRARRINSRFDEEDQLKHENELRMTRNVFLSFNLPVVLSSTNGTAKNLFVPSSRSRGGGPSLWCVVFPSLPRVDTSVDSGIPALLLEIIKHSRPLFAEIALGHVQDNPYSGSRDLNEYLNAMAETLAGRFGMLKRRTDEFEIGQLCLLLSSSCHVQDDNVDIIDSHFARLPEKTRFRAVSRRKWIVEGQWPLGMSFCAAFAKGRPAAAFGNDGRSILPSV
ncbi:hypothetical protein V7S43_007854 [Phytophthora oleae]|uniref:Crinkler effector protein N-terminal domain-containing protein n=1 Tax=Phytophthora oleae TaxID=2107226 RepID=A0ABD3FM79_9STRA